MLTDDRKNWIIVILIILIMIMGLISGIVVSRFKAEIESLKTDRNDLAAQIDIRNEKIEEMIEVVLEKDRIIDSLMLVFKAQGKTIGILTMERDELLDKLIVINSDSSYVFLQEIAYNYPGVLEYMFNALQVKGIHADWIRARSAENIIPELNLQIENCKLQFTIRDSTEKALKEIISFHEYNLDDCQKINEKNGRIISDLEKIANKEQRSKNFWRFTAAIEPVAIAVIVVLISAL